MFAALWYEHFLATISFKISLVFLNRIQLILKKHKENIVKSWEPLIIDRSIGFHSNSRDWLFWVFMMSKINPLLNKSVLFWQDVWTAFSIFMKNSRNQFQSMEISLLHMHPVYLPLYQNCIDNVVLISLNVMWNIRNEVDKTFVRTK